MTEVDRQQPIVCASLAIGIVSNVLGIPITDYVCNTALDRVCHLFLFTTANTHNYYSVTVYYAQCTCIKNLDDFDLMRQQIKSLLA